MTAARLGALERTLVVCAVLALALGVFDVAAALVDPEAIATSDFAVFRAGGALVLRGTDPYDRAAQEEVMRAVLGGEREGGHLAFLLPPHGALLFAPLALIGLVPAFVVFSLLLSALLARLVVVLADLAQADVRAIALLVCALGPVHATFRLGQLAIVCALALAELARALRDGRDVHAGIALVVLSLKPQFVPVVAIFLVGAARWRVLGSFALGSLAALAATSVVLGPSVWLDWAGSLGGLEEGFAVATPPYMVNARGTLARWLGDPVRRALTSSIAWALALVAGVVAGWAGRRTSGAPPPRAPLGLALALALALLFSPHLFFHDVLSWCVPVALARGASHDTARRRWDLLALFSPAAFLVAAAIEPALGLLLPVAPQLSVPLVATAWLVRDVRSPRAAAA